MATVTETTGTLPDVVDDLATNLAALADWSDADTTVVNDGSTDDWHNNGRVFKNANSGTYLLFYISNGDVRNPLGSQVSGLRFVTSSDWDSADHHPAGYTNLHGDELGSQWDPHKALNRRESFQILDWGRVEDAPADTDRWASSGNILGSRNCGIGLWSVSQAPGMSDLRTRNLTYFESVDNDRLQVMVWDNNDATYGIAGWLSWEYVGNKFWEDGVTPFVMVSRDSRNQGSAAAMYGFKSLANCRAHRASSFKRAIQNNGNVGCDRGVVSPGRWGRLNPDGADDTFFFRRPTIYGHYGITHRNRPALDYTPRALNPVGLVEQAIPNLPGEGASHGDVVTDASGKDYRVGVQSGAGRGDPIGIGLRYE